MCREQNKVLALNNHRKTLAFVVVVVKNQRSYICSAIPLRRSFKSACRVFIEDHHQLLTKTKKVFKLLQ